MDSDCAERQSSGRTTTVSVVTKTESTDSVSAVAILKYTHGIFVVTVCLSRKLMTQFQSLFSIHAIQNLEKKTRNYR